MYTSTFTFSPIPDRSAFQSSLQALSAAAQSVPGYMGEESWENPATGVVCIIYYWRTMDALQQMAAHQDQLWTAPSGDAWRLGYQVVIAEIVTFYGDGRIAHLLNRADGTHSRASPGAIGY